MRLLLVEDEPQMADALTAALSRYDIIVDHAATLAIAEDAARDNVHDVIVLDRQLPDGDGLSLILHLRSIGSKTPVIVLTAQGTVADRVHGLDRGADDYLAKPFAVEELLARVRALLRRPPTMNALVVRIGALEFSLDSREVFVNGKPLELPRRELLVLEALVRRQGRTVLRSALEEAVYNFDDEIQSNALDSHVSRLRRKLVETDAGVTIHSMRGVGYLMRPAC
ncbi:MULTISPECIES: response regulator transcription factor [unclassified Mesorhizobium]|uniref:response regulator transcription factor n=1 Tax=unclassified Mesorhizobium TaxID=325217 RepID=UPI000966A69D|nr:MULTISPECIES: response regulator transcription factor [unclassified Mesorhizobium]MBN9256736.1 response regulator transcription factor [Mesorhizobium sp.]MBN9269237.1 response regulator transcription factor [Mesorhizobium sp.]OJX83481.1 MAG: DNA-binding response regulator [Mesorhizobium sp. 65-26]